MEQELLDQQDVERAKMFWAGEDVDQIFNKVIVYLEHLKETLKKNTATDKELVQGLRLLKSLDLSPTVSTQHSSVVQVVIGSVEVQPANMHNLVSSLLPPANSTSSPTVASAGREELLPPLTPVHMQYQLHSCSKACLPRSASTSQATSPFWAQNPLKVPLLCGFKRLSAVQLTPCRDPPDSTEDSDVVYKAPCGQSLRNHEDVMRFLVATESYDVLKVDLFTFNPSVRLDPPVVAGPWRPELDLSRGAEATPVELSPGDDGARPPDFRYRKERWPHGCFLSGPTLFKVCCDCTDGCVDAQSCACIAMTSDGHQYTYHRLAEPVPSGLYECGPWCNCNRLHCQNRVVQRGISVRLQVFQTKDRGWGVRCRDDLDRGTFVCTFAGVVLRRTRHPVEPQPLKMPRCDLPSDDEVELVTEWLASPVQEWCSPPPPSPPTSLPLHVPVIQRSSESGSTSRPDRDKGEKILVGGVEAFSPSAGDASQLEKAASPEAEVNKQKNLKRTSELEQVYLIDATKEGNVSRFINHSCKPNLFIQNVFTDCHEPGFPVIAFFTNRVVKAGSELTWDYSANTKTPSLLKQEVPCLCGTSACRGLFTIEENPDVCEAEGPATVQDH